MNILSKKAFFILSILVVAFFYIFDIGNIDAMRQGTEGFYLQISKEMFQKGSFLTPYYNGIEHWSKPPLHFWNALGLYYLSGKSSLFAGRLSVTLISLLGLILISFWNKKHFNVPKVVSFLVLASSFGFLKYSRIYMMEIPLAIFSVLASLYFYSYLKEKNIQSLIWAIVFLALSSLVKGPVSMVMCIGGAGIFYLCSKEYRNFFTFKSITLWSVLAVLLGSIWYIACYIKYGQHFIEYFFLRENLGKFTAKSYPISSVIGGLMIYGLPWSLFLPHLLTNLKKRNLFLIINFLFFFLLWFIPSQRSHHYAIPALPFFLLLIVNSLYHSKKEGIVYLIGKILASILFLAITTLVVLSALFIHNLQISHFSFIITLLLFLVATITLILSKNIKYQALGIFLSLSTMWILYIPNFYLPIVPGSITSSLKDKPIAVIFRKPYYIAEAINKEVKILNENEAKQYLQNNSTYLFVIDHKYHALKLHSYSPINKWRIWKRGNKIPDFIYALKQRSIDSLVEYMYLLEK